jgi:PhoH-like ATPase
MADTVLDPNGQKLMANAFVILHAASGNGSAIARVMPNGATMRLLKGSGPSVWGIRPRNKEQHFALDLLLDDNITLVTLVGQAGTGKTLLALAAGLQKATEEQAYQRLLVSRPVFPLGKDLGFLPGDVNDKLRPWMQPVHDNLELLLGISSGEKQKGRSSEELFDMDMVHIEPLTYIRGRSIPRQFILVDEAQNLTPHEAKTIITRAGDDTKIVLTGDPYQIDNPYVDSTNNGLVHVVNRFKGQSIAGHITLTKGERSDLAERAANLL